MAEAIHLYNILPYNFLNTGVASAFCNLFDGHLCDFVMSIFADADPAIDNTDRYDVYMSNLPGGAGYKNIVHYGQLIAHDVECFLRYDHGEKENQARYGQKTPPSYDMSLIDFPIAILSGSGDKLADPQDVKWTSEQLAHTLIFNHEYYMGHMSFAIGKDMSWFSVDCMAMLNHYNQRCDRSTLGSKFEVGNEKCEAIFQQEQEMFLY